MNDISLATAVNTAFKTFKKNLLQGKQSSKYYRQIFLDACYEYADNIRACSNLRTQSAKSDEEIEKLVLEICGELTSIRDHIVNWVLLESKIDPSKDFRDALLDMLNRLFELRSQQSGVNTNIWIKAHHVFVYEIFLYIVAALMKNGASNILHNVFNNRYIRPETEAHEMKRFTTFEIFWDYLKAEQIEQQAKRTDLPFEDIIEAELLIVMMACITEGVHWQPQTFYEPPPRTFPFFFKASQRRDFNKIATITGITDAKKLHEAVKAGLKSIGSKMNDTHDFYSEILERMNMNNLDTID